MSPTFRPQPKRCRPSLRYFLLLIIALKRDQAQLCRQNKKTPTTKPGTFLPLLLCITYSHHRPPTTCPNYGRIPGIKKVALVTTRAIYAELFSEAFCCSRASLRFRSDSIAKSSVVSSSGQMPFKEFGCFASGDIGCVSFIT